MPAHSTCIGGTTPGYASGKFTPSNTSSGQAMNKTVPEFMFAVIEVFNSTVSAGTVAYY